MEFERTVTLSAKLEDVWSLTEDLQAVAECIPGLSDYVELSPGKFSCVMVQKVGHVKTRLDLENRLTDIQPLRSVTVISEGEDPRLRATVRAAQSFDLSSKGDSTEIQIGADIHVTGKIATFGGRIILAKAEQIVVSALENVSKLLNERGLSVDSQGTADG